MPDPLPRFTPPPEMTDPAPAPEHDSAIDAPAAAPARSRIAPIIAAGVIAFLLLAGGEVWLSQTMRKHDDSGTLAAQSARISRIDQRVAQLKSRLASLESKVAAIKPAATPAPQPAPSPSLPPGLASQITAMQASLAALSTTTLADHAAMAGLQSKAADLPKLVDRAETLARIAQASLALQNGAPLGTIPNAPEPLMRYATTAPPTIGGLKASFPAYARKATQAGGDVTHRGGVWQNAKARIESLVTIRHDREVLVGSRVSGIIGVAATDLDRDDLTGAVAALKPLPAAAQAAMAPWTAQATSLIEARTALATLAEHR